MAIDNTKIAERLLKKSSGLAETKYGLSKRGLSEEAFGTYNMVTPNAIWAEGDKIPETTPSLASGDSQGVVEYHSKYTLTRTDLATDVAFYDPLGIFVDIIDSRFGYNYGIEVWSNDGSTKLIGGDWIVDIESGIITFYDPTNAAAGITVDGDNPPQVSFYKYIGEKGLNAATTDSGINVKDPVRVMTLDNLDDYDVAITGFTTFPVIIDDVTLVDGDTILVKKQTNKAQNGIYEVIGGELHRQILSDGSPLGEVGINDYVFVKEGAVGVATSWVLSKTSGSANAIIVGIDEQTWSLFSQSKEYKAKEGIQLVGQEFNIKLNEVDVVRGSGLDQSTQGLKIETTLQNTISDNTDNIATLSGITDDLQISIDEIQPLLAENAGDALIYTENGGGEGIPTFDVAVDDMTIKVVGDELRSQILTFEIDFATTSNEIDEVETKIVLSQEPVGYVSAYVNGVEYLVSLTGVPSENIPFFFNTGIPTFRSILKYSPLYGGFALESGTDLIQVKYNYIDIN